MKTYEPRLGSSIETASREAVLLAVGGEPITFKFNESNVIAPALKNKTKAEVNAAVQLMVKAFYAEREAESKRWQATNEGKLAKAEDAADILRKQIKVDDAMARLTRVIESGSPVALMRLLRTLVEDGDRVGVSYDRKQLATALEKLGYKEDDAVGLSKEAYEDTVVSRRWIIGQMLTFLNKGSSPHPVAVRFIDQWLQAVLPRRAVKTKRRAPKAPKVAVPAQPVLTGLRRLRA